MTPSMQLAQSDVEELIALRKLEQAVRACGLPSIMVSGQDQLESLAAALKEIDEARANRETVRLPEPPAVHR